MLDQEFKQDCKIWLIFLSHVNAVCRPFTDFDNSTPTEILTFTSDASGNLKLGFATYYDKRWVCHQWEPGYIETHNPSIKYLELYALCIGIFAWDEELTNGTYVIWCENKSTHDIVNRGASKCKNCMFLLRLLTLNNLIWNCRLAVRYIDTKSNYLSDSLSRLDYDLFFDSAPEDVEHSPSELPTDLWPASKLWQS